MMTLAQAHHLLPGSSLQGDGQTLLTRVHSDSRSVRDGDLFVALRGDKFDGHRFLTSARGAGAAAFLAESGAAEAAAAAAAGMSGLLVPDSLLALQQLAAAWRRRCHLPLAAITGSNGKTTVTQMVAAILRTWLGEGAFATQGNLNNHIGLPLTLLRLRQDDAVTHRAGVVELGMNQPGEVALLARLAAPTVALVNNAQREHQEFMQTVQAVAEENGSVIAALPASGTVVLPADDAYAARWRQMAGSRRVLTFALDNAADVTGLTHWQIDHWQIAARTPLGPLAIKLRMPGRHNAKNALAATACALALGAPLTAIAQGLAAFTPVDGRSALRHLQLGAHAVSLVDDSYNANPDSVAAAIQVLAELPAPRWLLLGDMGEVGQQGPAFHREAGLLAREKGIEHLWCVGVLSAETARAFNGDAQAAVAKPDGSRTDADKLTASGAAPAQVRARHFDAVPALNTVLADASQLPPAASILIKGSRFMAMERVVRALMAHSPDSSSQPAGASSPANPGHHAGQGSPHAA